MIKIRLDEYLRRASPDRTSGSGDSEREYSDFVETILTRAAAAGASDIHIEPAENGFQIRYRIHQVLRTQMVVGREVAARMNIRLKYLAGVDLTEGSRVQEGSFQFPFEDRMMSVRFSAIPVAGGQKMVLRLFDPKTYERELDALGFLPGELRQFEAMIRRRSGLILVTGGTGSGKSTTCFTVLHQISSEKNCTISIEDPVEVPLSFVTQFEAGAGEMDLNRLLAFSLRQDPDIIFFGEIRDQKSAQAAIEAGATGHLVLSTLHARDVFSVPARLVELGVSPMLIKETLIGAVAQRLMRVRTPDHQGRLRVVGQSGVFEIAAFDPRLVDLCLSEEGGEKEENRKEVERHARELGWRSMAEALWERFEKGYVDAQEALRLLNEELL